MTVRTMLDNEESHRIHRMERVKRDSLKLSIVGMDGRNWVKEQEEKVREVVKRIILHHHDSNIPIIGKVDDSHKKFIKGLGSLFTNLGKITVVSGHCPVGEERWYCVDCKKWLETDEEMKLHDRRQETVFVSDHRKVLVHRKGGVDTIVEIVTTELGIKKDIRPAVCTLTSKPVDGTPETCVKIRPATYEECVQWYKENPRVPKDGHFWKHHFKPRNIKVATVSDVLYDIEFKGNCRHCKSPIRGFRINNCRYCKGTRIWSGAVWTKNYAEKLGKEVHQIVL